MKTSATSREGLTKVFLNLMVLTAAGILIGLSASCATAPQPGYTAAATPTPTPERQLSEEEKRQEDWRTSMAKVAMPKKGCFTAAYPKTEWQEVACKPAPPYPLQPRNGPRAFVVGAGDDVTPQAPSGFISSTTGSFDSVSGVTNESGRIGNAGPLVPDAYTLQINTDFFNSTACAGSPNPTCRGWEQFVFFNDGTAGSLYIQYWLIRYNTTCPASWTQFTFTGGTTIYCVRNDSMGATSVPNQPITNLANLRMTGTVTATSDQNTFTVGTPMMYGVTGDNSVNAAAGWHEGEFNVFGPGGNSSGGSEATFNAGSTIVPRTRITYGGTAPPICTNNGYTAETNNLSFGPTAPAPSGPGPAILFSESSVGGAMSNCAAATAVGDTHLLTFSGLAYDFQATGDFLLAQADPNFVVQTRQVSGAPTWPDAAVNSAVATQMGNDKVAICLAPTRVNLNGANKDLADGTSVSTPDGVDITRKGNIYFISDSGGNWVRATVNTSPDYIDASVGIGRWPAKVSGLLANPNGNVNQVATRDGAVLTIPFSQEALYGRFADSWRISPRESLLSACSNKEIEQSVPRKLFFANDLDPQVSARTRAVCVAAGVKDPALLDACTLDVAVIGNDNAAKVFVGARAPTAVGNLVGTYGSKSSVFLKWWWLWLLLLLILILLVVWILRRRRTP
jgi:hypothetical protein